MSDFHTNYQIRWQNYRRFKDTGWITLRPISILIGPNNSGKTSVISPLLLLTQTITSEDGDTPLVSRGSLVDVGNYRDYVHLHDTSSDVFFGLRFHYHERTKRLKRLGTYPPGAIELTFGSGEELQQTTLKKYELFDIFMRSYIERTQRQNQTFSLSGAVSAKTMLKAERAALRRSDPVNFLFSPTSTISAFKRDDDTARNSDRFSKEFSHYLRAIGYAYSSIRSLVGYLSYIGPLRDRPRRYYQIAAEAARTVGPRGENAPHLFRQHQQELQAEVNSWVQRFEFGKSLMCKGLTEDFFKLCFVNGKEQTNIADAGFGASQVLPLIIQALVAPKDSLTIAEQPEIHLNPRLQSTLGDLFAHMANSGHRVLVETHSEHLLLRLRTLVATGIISEKDVAIYFVEKTDDQSVIREVPIESNGNIRRDQWPKGFFDDALRESMMLASAQSGNRAST